MGALTKTKRWRKRLGRAGENAAADMLRFRGFEIILRNCKTPRAELDIIARDGFTLVFVEVKTLWLRPDKKSDFRPAGNLTLSQKQRIRRAAIYYMRMLGHPEIRYRIDLVEIWYSFFGPAAILHHPNAFGYDTLYLRRSKHREDYSAEFGS